MSMDPGRFDRVVEDVRRYLRFLRDTGAPGVFIAPETAEIIRKWSQSPRRTGGQRQAPISGRAHPEDGMATLRAAFEKCRGCFPENAAPLASVFGEGPPDAGVMFVGCFPEPADGRSRRPYSGEIGVLLTKIIQAMRLERGSVYVCHAVKCLPPEGKAPSDDMVNACRHHLTGQIRAIRPKVICALGEIAARSVPGIEAPIEQVRGAFHYYEGIAVMPTLDPADLLSDPALKRMVWTDMQKVMKKLSHG